MYAPTAAEGIDRLRTSFLHATGDRAECVEVAKDCFARWVRACLGQSAISSRKLEHGRELVILGIQLSVDSEGVNFWPAPDKVSKWSDMICKAILEGVCSCMAVLLHSLIQLHCTLHGRRSREATPPSYQANYSGPVNPLSKALGELCLDRSLTISEPGALNFRWN